MPSVALSSEHDLGQHPVLEPSALHLLHTAGRTSGGVGPAATGLALAQRALGAATQGWTNDDPPSAARLLRGHSLPPDLLCAYPALGPRRLSYSPRMERAAAGAPGSRFSVLHLHAIWTACSRSALLWRAAHQGPVVIAPHGSLEPRALQRSPLRKRLALRFYEAANLRTAACLHALSEAEARGFRDFGLTNPIAVIPNGIRDDWLDSAGEGARFRARFALPADRRLLLFLSRVTPIKGLPLFLQALADLRSQLADWLFVIAGPDEFGHRKELEELITSLSVGELVRFVGPLYGQEKRDAFAASECFVLPSQSEGAPLAPLESLGAGVPVLTTTASPLPEIARLGLGWRVAPEAAALREALAAAISTSSADLTTMGARGRRFVSEHCRWQRPAQQTLALYHWLLGAAPRPCFVALH